MGLFDKKFCDICGEKIGLLGNKKLEDGNMCKNCAKKLSPWFSERRHSTLEEIKKQLQYREDNKERVRAFTVTRQYDGSFKNLYIDESKMQFAIGSELNEEENPDIVDMSQITSCRLDVDESREEEKYKNKDGEMQSYYPPRYNYFYDYYVRINVNSPWFDDMYIKLNSFRVADHSRQEMMDNERTGNEIVAVLSARGPQGGMPYGQPPMGYPQQGMGYAPQPQQINYGGQPVRAQVPQQGGQWRCSCGTVNTGRFCSNCGQPQPQAAPAAPRQIRCDKCGWVAPDPGNIPRFCPMCGDPINQNDMN